MHTDYTVQETLCTIHTLFTHCSRDLQQLYLEKNNKNGPHGTIYTFKKKKIIYVFSFQQNNQYSL